ncbi:hypothetical protein WI75_25685 [Burkholderia ubonensis]|nr:hypothetical protein WI75_25685 [Burkholderia ubonensis]
MLAVATVTMASASLAHADTVEQDIQIRAQVPAASSFVQPVNGWPTNAVDFGYNVFTKQLQNPQAIALKMQNNQGGTKGGQIMAHLATPAVLSDGTTGDDIPVDVKISSTSVATPVKLNTTPQAIYTNNTGVEEDGSLSMSVANSAPAPKAGMNYQGTVGLIFDFQPVASK